MCFGKVSATADRDGDGYCLVQENGVIFWSDDGHQWHRAAQYVSGKLRCLDFYSRSNGVAAGDVTAGKQNIVYTTDGGKTSTKLVTRMERLMLPQGGFLLLSGCQNLGNGFCVIAKQAISRCCGMTI